MKEEEEEEEEGKARPLFFGGSSLNAGPKQKYIRDCSSLYLWRNGRMIST